MEVPCSIQGAREQKRDSFNALYEASCHCGRVKYQLSREKPLDAKYCHCTTCQDSGVAWFVPSFLRPLSLTTFSFSMVLNEGSNG